MRAADRSLDVIAFVSEHFRDIIRRRLSELAGLALVTLALLGAIALATWSVQDPSLSHATQQPIHNLLGFAGAIFSDLAMQLLGQYGDERVPPALEALAQYPVEWQCGTVTYFYYFHYYAVQANYQAGGKYWNAWHPRVRELLLAKQNADGSWDAPPGSTYESNAGLVGPNRIYSSAMASLVLEIYMHFLPAYQR